MSDQVPALLRDLSEVDFADYRQALVERKLEAGMLLSEEELEEQTEAVLNPASAEATADDGEGTDSDE